MYKLYKPKGNNSNITIENTDTKASVNIGRLSMEAIRILEADGFKFNDDTEESLKYKDEWSFKIKDTTATTLAKLSLPMHKPVRDQRKKSEQKDNKNIDAMDVLLGLAKYK